MSRRIVFVVSGDPRVSARTAEAIRIAAGIAAWKTVEVNLCLRGASVLALDEAPEELVDADHFTQFLPIFREFSRTVFVQKGSPFLSAIRHPVLEFQELSDPELADLTSQCDYVARF